MRREPKSGRLALAFTLALAKPSGSWEGWELVPLRVANSMSRDSWPKQYFNSQFTKGC